LVHVNPVVHGVASPHAARHWLSLQTFPSPHSLENLQVFEPAVQLPATQASPPAQSFAPVHGHGPSVPPQASQVPPAQALPVPHSAFVVHALPASADALGPGGVTPVPVPEPVPEPVGFGAGETAEQPYASHA
jgi:hypothetical protein